MSVNKEKREKEKKREKKEKKCNRKKCNVHYYKHYVTFTMDNNELGLYKVYQVDHYPITAYGYKTDCINPDLPIELVSTVEKGLGIKDVECENVYIQFEIGSLLRDCSVKDVYCDVGYSKRVKIYGSNVLGNKGEHIYTCNEKNIKFPMYGKFKYYSISAKEISILSFCMKRVYVNAYGYFYTTTQQDISGNSFIPMEKVSLSEGFNKINTFTIECKIKGVYVVNTNICRKTEPNSYGLYVNGVVVDGFLYNDVGNGILHLNSGDQLQVMNQSNNVLSLLNGFTGQTLFSLNIWRIM